MTETLPEFEDHRVQLVYEILCDCELHGKPREEHWEGWQARRIVAALTTSSSPIPNERVDAEPSDDFIERWPYSYQVSPLRVNERKN